MLKEEVVTTGIPLQVIKYPNFNWTLIVVKIVLTLAGSFFDSMIFRNSSKFVVENSPKPSLLSLTKLLFQHVRGTGMLLGC